MSPGIATCNKRRPDLRMNSTWRLEPVVQDVRLLHRTRRAELKDDLCCILCTVLFLVNAFCCDGNQQITTCPLHLIKMPRLELMTKHAAGHWGIEPRVFAASLIFTLARVDTTACK
eukprot:5305530-Pleurochrysis_carterae.AAC.5